MSTVKFYIQFGGQYLTLPINPSELKITRSQTNTDLDIVGLGKTARKGEMGLIKTSIESFMPGPNSYFYTGVKPASFIKMMERLLKAEIQGEVYVPKFITSGLPKDIEMYFVVENFEYDDRAGEEEDVYYKLDIKEYRPYGVKTVKSQLSGLSSARATSVAAQPVTNTRATYVVQSGDCLWNIAKACCGDGSRYMEIYALNTDTISNPSVITPGIELELPDGWSTPTNVTKLQNVAKSVSNSTNVVGHRQGDFKGTDKTQESVRGITTVTTNDQYYDKSYNRPVQSGYGSNWQTSTSTISSLSNEQAIKLFIKNASSGTLPR